jgi:hypothetical protein
VTRWDLSEPDTEIVRQHFSDNKVNSVSWLLEVGDRTRRREVHAAYGGQQQGGISTPRRIRDILIFTDPVNGARHGYDRFEGLHEDGTYSYTGEGQFGDQVFERGNVALRDAAKDGRTIRLFTTKGVHATYVGAFTTGSPTYRLETIPDNEGVPRQGIIFNLEPLDADLTLLPVYGGSEELSDSLLAWTPPEYSDVIVAQELSQTHGDRVVSRVEFELQGAFGNWLTAQGTKPSRMRLPTPSSVIEPDLYVEASGWIVEAKRSAGRIHVRTAIGQVLDYAHVATAHGWPATPVILLPGQPEPDLVELIAKLGIVLAVRSGNEFEIHAPTTH